MNQEPPICVTSSTDEDGLGRGPLLPLSDNSILVQSPLPLHGFSSRPLIRDQWFRTRD